MTKGVTSGGFAYEYDENRLDDMRFVDVLAVVTDQDAPLSDRAGGASKLTEMLLGRAQKKALYEHIGKKYDGRVPRAELEQALGEIMRAAYGEEAVKNS